MKKIALVAALPFALALAACGDGADETATTDDAAMTAEGDAAMTDGTGTAATGTAATGEAADPMAGMTAEQRAEMLDESAENLEEQADRIEDTDEAAADRLEAQAEAQQQERDRLD